MEKHKKLIIRLLERTARGLLEWKPTIDENAFRLSFSDNSLQISYKKSRGSNVEDYVVELINDEGIVVDSFVDVDLDKTEIDEINNVWFSRMKDLYIMARRTSLGSEKVLNSILRDLDDE